MNARLESLEETMRKVCTALEKVQANNPIKSVEENLRRIVATVPTPTPLPAPQATFASVAAGTNPRIVVTPVSQQGWATKDNYANNHTQPVQSLLPVDGAQGVPVGTRQRSRSESSKRKADERDTDSDGFRRQGRPRQRKTATGTSQVKVDDVGEYIAPVEFYIGNTDRRTNKNTISTVLKRCAAAVEGGEDLVIEEVELLTKEVDPRTKWWKVVAPYRFKSLLEKDEVYPGGWRHRAFFGSRSSKDKKPRLDQGANVEQQVLLEQQQEADPVHHEEGRAALKLRIEQLESRMRNSTEGPMLSPK